jgi:Rhs element Vgr protein
LSRTHQLLAATVTNEVNRIAAARLVYLDGSAATSDFPLSNADTFVPGAEVEVLAGPPDSPLSIFKGVVVSQSLKLRERSSPQLVVECRHKALKLTLGSKSACFADQSDSDIISALLQSAGLDAEVETTNVVHAQQVQFRASDWEFLLTRAGANGKLVFTSDDKVIVKKPAMAGSAVATLLFGATILELDAQMDARQQWAGVKSVTWDPAQQAVVIADATEPELTEPGNLSSDALAEVGGLSAYELRHAALGEDEAQAWADSEWLKAKLGKVRGRIKCEGIATVRPGDVVALGGVGARFTGDVLVTGVRHDLSGAQSWKTHLQFGSVDRWLGEPASGAETASKLLPAVSGLQVAVVTGNEDPQGEHRVRVRLPLVSADGDGVWARIATLDAGQERGTFFRPELGDEVVVGFFENDPRRAVILGMLHSSAKAAPLTGSDDNHEKIYQSRSKLKLYFNDHTKVMRLETPAGNKLTLSDEDGGIKLEDQNGNVIELSPTGIRIETQKELKLSGAIAAELSSDILTTVKGKTLKLN